VTDKPIADLNATETTLRDVLAYIAADRLNEITNDHGWPTANADQCAAMTSLIISSLTAVVLALRDHRALPASRGELVQVIDTVALSVIENVMGPPIAAVVH